MESLDEGAIVTDDSFGPEPPPQMYVVPPEPITVMVTETDRDARHLSR